ncbi:MAG: hypothetical protein RI554_04585 [Trueperaceae bacterium]|nr:hypothetical protein [Trueperaceae bacterium]
MPAPDAPLAGVPHEALTRLHATPHRTVFAFAGAGSLALAWLHAVGGSSRTLLEAVDHYHPASLADALGGTPDAAVSGDVARDLARGAQARADALTRGDAPPGPRFGLGLTATIATDRDKRGDHRAVLAAADALGVDVTTLRFAKGARDRAGEEAALARWVVHVAGRQAGVLGEAAPARLEGDAVEGAFQASEAYAAFLADDAATLHVDVNGRPTDAPPPPVLVSGSFHPMHPGHRDLAAAAEAHLGRPAGYELPLVNADKAPMDPADARLRAAQAYGDRPIVLGHAALFSDKAEAWPGTTFVLGADTARRVLEPRFYGGTEALRAALGRIRAAGARFLVAGRAGDDGFRTLEDLDVPADLADLFAPLPGFRVDLSSTDVRAGWPLANDP